jgi:hypothetical protein
LVGELRVPARVSSLSVLPSPLSGRVGVHILTFEACSSFTRVTACRVAHPPYVGFIARLRPGQFPSSDARKLPSSTNNLLGWVLPPLVICAVEAHPITPVNARDPMTAPALHRVWPSGRRWRTLRKNKPNDFRVLAVGGDRQHPRLQVAHRAGAARHSQCPGSAIPLAAFQGSTNGPF